MEMKNKNIFIFVLFIKLRSKPTAKWVYDLAKRRKNHSNMNFVLTITQKQERGGWKLKHQYQQKRNKFHWFLSKFHKPCRTLIIQDRLKIARAGD